MTISQENIEKLAKICHEANKAFCETIGDNSCKSWEETSDDVKESAYTGVKSIVDNPSVTPEDLHITWSKSKTDDGWTYGKVKDETKKTHPALVPYNKLPAHQRFKDFLFRNIILTYIKFIKTPS